MKDNVYICSEMGYEKGRRGIMPVKKLASFDVSYLQILDEAGNCDEKLKPGLSDDDLRKLYELMALARKFDEKCLNLQRQGRMGTYASILGQEATQIGSVYPMKKEDWLIPSFRESGAIVARGTPMRMLMQYWAGDERGQNVPPSVNNFPVAIPVGSQPLHAVGIAWAAKLKGDKIVTLAFFGDGATSEGDVHEAMNFAGVFKVPCVFLCSNNQWAISLPRSRQSASQTLAQKAIAYGFEGMQVDGNDVLAVYKSVSDAMEKARKGGGPTFIECFTYRMGDHTTADDASRYRDPKEVEAWKSKDPISRFKKYLLAKKVIDDEFVQKIESRCSNQVEESVKAFESVAPPDPKDIFAYTFKEMPKILKDQMDYLVDMIKQQGEKHG